MNSILQWLIVVVLCFIEGCVCWPINRPVSYRDPAPVRRFHDSPTDPPRDQTVATSNPDTWRAYGQTATNLGAPPRPLLSDQPRPWYEAPILRANPTISFQPSRPPRDQIVATSNPDTWIAYGQTVTNLGAPPRPLLSHQPQPWYGAPILQAKPTISLKPSRPVVKDPFYNQKLLRSKSDLKPSEQRKMLNAANPGLEHVDREWLKRQNFNEDPSIITAIDDFMVELACFVYKAHVTVIVISDFYDPVGHSFLRGLLKGPYRDTIVIRAYFDLCPKTRFKYDVGLYSPTFVILSNGQQLFKTIDLGLIKAHLNEAYMLREGKNQFAPPIPPRRTQQFFPPLQPPPWPAENDQWWWSSKQTERQLSLPSSSQHPMTRQRNRSSSELMSSDEIAPIYEPKSDEQFMNLLLSAKPNKCIVVAITNDDRETLGDIQLFLGFLAINYSNIMIIKARVITCDITAKTFKVETQFPTFVMFEKDRSMQEHILYGTDGFNENLKKQLKDIIETYCPES